MRPRNDLLAILEEAVSSAFAQGGDGEETLVRRLRGRLRSLEAGSRRARASGALVFGVCAVALVGMPLSAGLPVWQRLLGSTALVTVMLIAAAGVHEASRVVTLVGALEDLLITGEGASRYDVVLAFRDGLRAEVSPPVDWHPLAAILADAYDSAALATMALRRAGVPTGLIEMSQPLVHVWHDAVRIAHRRGSLDALLATATSDPEIAAYHGRLRACREDLGV
jgi:hypothetical protein